MAEADAEHGFAFILFDYVYALTAFMTTSAQMSTV
jgi:hypothetical protein